MTEETIKVLESHDKKVYDRSDETNDLLEVLRSSIDAFKRYKYPELYSIIKSKYLFAWDMKMHLNKIGRENATAEVYPLIASIHDSFVANLFDTNISPRVSAVSSEDKPKAKDAQNFLDWANDISGSEHAKQLIRSEASLIGTSYWMCWWEKYTKETKIPKDNGESTTIKRKISQPILEHVSFFEMFYDMSTRDFYRARWKARRKIMSTENIKRRYKSFHEFTDDDIEKINDTIGDALSPHDFTKIYNVKNYEHLLDNAELLDDTLMWFLEDNILRTVVEDDKFAEVIEVYTDDELVILINGHEYVRTGNPFPLGDPFAIITFEKQFGTCTGIGIGQKLLTYQRQATMYWCNIKDALIQHLNPMYIWGKGRITDYDWEVPFDIEYIPWKVWYAEWGQDLIPFKLTNEQAIQLAIWQLNDTVAKAYEAIGTNSYVQGWQGKVERSLGAANLKVAITMTRLKPLNHSMGAFEQRVFEQWLTLASVKMDKDQEIRIFDENGNAQFVKVEPLDLINKFDITVDVDALRDLTRNERAKWAIELLNSIANFNINPISQTPAIAPEKVIEYVASELDFDLSPMTSDEKVAYMQEHIQLTQQIQQWTGNTPKGDVIPQTMPGEQPAQTTQPAQDFQNVDLGQGGVEDIPDFM